MAGILSSLACVNNDISEHTGTFHNPGELWEVMKRSLRQLSVNDDAESVSGPAILLAHDFPSFAEREVNVLVFILKTAAGARKALFVVTIINKLVLQGAVILGSSDPYIQLVNRHLVFLLHGICYHDGVVLRTFHEGCVHQILDDERRLLSSSLATSCGAGVDMCSTGSTHVPTPSWLCYSSG